MVHSLTLPENLIDFHVANLPSRCEMYIHSELLNNFPGFFGEKSGKLGGTDNCRISCCFTSRSLFIYFLLCFLYYRAEILDGDKSLVIKNVVPSDEGAYVCEAQNSVGQITSKAQLVVNCEYIQYFSPFSLCAVVYRWGQQPKYIPSIDPMFDSTNKTVQSSLSLDGHKQNKHFNFTSTVSC